MPARTNTSGRSITTAISRTRSRSRPRSRRQSPASSRRNFRRKKKPPSNRQRGTWPNSAGVCSLAGANARRQGRWEDALKNLDKAVELDPRNPKNVNGLSLIYDLLRHYDDEAALFERAAAANPGSRNYSQMVRAQIELSRGDLKAAHSFLATLPADYDPDGQMTSTRLTLALYERDFDRAAKVLASRKQEELVGNGGTLVPASYWQGVIARGKGDEAAAKESLGRARTAIEGKLAGRQDDPILLATLGLIDAGLARKEDALREGRRAVELRPISEDA